MNEETIISEGGLTRREMLKKSALVGAVAWAAPVVSSFSTPAFAQVTVSPASCTDWNCGEPQDICGDSGPFGQCLCDVDTEGNAFCWENFLCNHPNAIVCTSSTDCAPGWRCATTCCSTLVGGSATCAPACGTNHTSTVTQGGLTAAG